MIGKKSALPAMNQFRLRTNTSSKVLQEIIEVPFIRTWLPCTTQFALFNDNSQLPVMGKEQNNYYSVQSKLSTLFMQIQILGKHYNWLIEFMFLYSVFLFQC